MTPGSPTLDDAVTGGGPEPGATPDEPGHADGEAPGLLTGLRRIGDHPVAGPAVKLVAGYLVLIEGLIQLVFGRVKILDVGIFGDRPIPVEVILLGAVIGSLYGLLAMGLILVYRASRIINFAQAQLGAVPAVAALLLVAKRGWPWLAVVPIVVVGSALLGGLVETTVVRRFSTAPRLILTVATIGVSLVLLVAEFLTKIAVGGDLVDTLSLEFPTPFASFERRLGVITFSGDHIVAVVVVAALVVALGAFFRYTDIGIAVRASAENADRAALLGIPVKRVSTVVWVLAAVLSAIGVFLRTPLVGLNLTGFTGLSILLFGLATAVLAGMESLPRALVAGMFIGVIDQASLFATRRASLAAASLFVVIVVALLFQKGRTARAFDAGVSSFQAVKDYRPVPAELRHLPEVRAARLWGSVALVALLAVLPWVAGSRIGLVTQGVLFAMVGVSLVILTGWAGQISLGQWAISGVGAAVAGGLASNHGWDFFATVFVGGLAGALVAVVIGLPALRIQGLFLAVTTLAFAFVIPNFVLTREYFAWLLPESGAGVARPVLWGRIDLNTSTDVAWFTISNHAKFYFVTLAFLGLSLAMARALRRNRTGRVLIGVRDNGRVMQAFGVNLARTRLAAFALSGFIAAMAGALFAYQQTSVDAQAYIPETSLNLFVMTVIGGVSSLPGALLGAAYVQGLPLLLEGWVDRAIVQILPTGVGLLILLLFLPGGLSEAFYRTRDRYLRWVATRHGIHVPSLVADSLVTGDEADPLTASLGTGQSPEGGAAGTVAEPVELLGCPACGARIPVHEAHLHEHFRTDGPPPGARRPDDTPPPDGRRRRTLSVPAHEEPRP